jgi:hypothetical protein
MLRKQMGLRQQRILEADERGIDAARGEENYARWNEAAWRRSRRHPVPQSKSKPSPRLPAAQPLAN